MLHRARTETELVASSVVVMGLISLFLSLARALNGGFERKILLCWGADAFIVVLGAPIGSIVLTPAASAVLRRVFYALALIQFVSYAYMEEAFYDAHYAPYCGLKVWFVLVPLLAGLILALVSHHHMTRKGAPSSGAPLPDLPLPGLGGGADSGGRRRRWRWLRATCATSSSGARPGRGTLIL